MWEVSGGGVGEGEVVEGGEAGLVGARWRGGGGGEVEGEREEEELDCALKHLGGWVFGLCCFVEVGPCDSVAFDQEGIDGVAKWWWLSVGLRPERFNNISQKESLWRQRS